ncbi:MAG: protein kinase [Candidatus Woesearchaeota archaeon]|nr:protein kinase [Candidatus Woesearchaeota archaeon]
MSLEKRTLAEFNRRFSKSDYDFFLVNLINEALALSYDARFTAKCIFHLVRSNVSPEKANEYGSRFDGKSIAYLSQFLIDASTANSFNQRFNANEIYCLISSNITHEIAEEYDYRFSGIEISKLRKAEIGPSLSNTYEHRHSADDIVRMHANHVPPSDSRRYKKRFNANAIIKLHLEGISPEKADSYPTNFSASELVYLVRKGISADYVKGFDSHLPGSQVIALINHNVPPDKIAEYAVRTDYTVFKRKKRKQEIGKGKHKNPYSVTQFSDHDLAILKKANVSPKAAANYGKDYTLDEKIALHRAGIKKHQADRFRHRFDGKEQAYLKREGSDVQTAVEYDPRFPVKDIAKLISEGVDAETAKKYDFRFDGSDITFFFKRGINDSASAAFDPRFNRNDISNLITAGIDTSVAGRYYKEFDSEDIILLNYIGITPETTPISRQTNLYPVLKGFRAHRRSLPLLDSVSFVGTGYNAVILFDKEKGIAYKCSKDLSNEIKAYKMLSRKKPRNDYIINMETQVMKRDEISIIELEYIDGITLGKAISDNIIYEYKDVAKYSYDIFLGICEMRESGLFHKDLHENNVMLDLRSKRCKIIDLGSTTENPNEVYSGNRAYGGNNDLISLGQLIYKMATGHNLFNKSSGLSTDSKTKEGIKTQREIVYANPMLKREYLNKARKDIKEDRLADLIIFLLDDNLLKQPPAEKLEKAKLMFEDYAKQSEIYYSLIN